jgi:hypothetical protein
MVLVRIDASPTAAHLMSQIPGLRHRVEETLGGIYETALELVRLHGAHFVPLVGEPMRLTLGNFVIWYQLDVPNARAKAVFVEMLPRAVQLDRGSESPLVEATDGEADDGASGKSVAS